MACVAIAIEFLLFSSKTMLVTKVDLLSNETDYFKKEFLSTQLQINFQNSYLGKPRSDKMYIEDIHLEKETFIQNKISSSSSSLLCCATSTDSPNSLLLFVSIIHLDCILCPYTAVVDKFLLVSQHLHVHVKGSIGKRYL